MIKIKELSQKAGMTQQEFADYLNISKRTVERWEQNERTINKRSCPNSRYRGQIEDGSLNMTLLETVSSKNQKYYS